MDRGASLDNMRDKFMKYRKTKLIEMLQPYVQEEPNFSLTDAQGKKRRTSLFKADKYSLAYALAERYAQEWETPKNHPDLFTSEYAGVTETLKPYKADDQLRDDLFNTAQEVHEQHLSDVKEFNDSYKEAMSRITSAGKEALRKARKGEGSIDANKIQGLDKVVQEIENESSNYLGLMQGYGKQSGTIEDHVFEMLKGGRKLKRRLLSKKNYEDALELIRQRNPGGLESMLRDEPLPDPSEVELSPESGQGQQQEFEMEEGDTPLEKKVQEEALSGVRRKSGEVKEERSQFEPSSRSNMPEFDPETGELVYSPPSREEIEAATPDPKQEIIGEVGESLPGDLPSGQEIAEARTDEEIAREELEREQAGREEEELRSKSREDRNIRKQQEADEIRKAFEVSKGFEEREKKESFERQRELKKSADKAEMMEALRANAQMEADERSWNIRLEERKAERERVAGLKEEQEKLKALYETSSDTAESYHTKALPNVDSDIELKVTVGGKGGGKISFGLGDDGNYILKLTDSAGNFRFFNTDQATKRFGKNFKSIANAVIKKDNERWQEKAMLAGLATPIDVSQKDLGTVTGQTYFTRETKDKINNHVVNAMKGLGSRMGGIDIADYTEYTDAVDAAFDKMRGHVADLDKKGGFFDSIKSVGFKKDPKLSTADNYMNAIEHVMGQAGKAGFKPNKKLNTIENMQNGLQFLAEKTGNEREWSPWAIAGGVSILAVLLLFYSVMKD